MNLCIMHKFIVYNNNVVGTNFITILNLNFLEKIYQWFRQSQIFWKTWLISIIDITAHFKIFHMSLIRFNPCEILQSIYWSTKFCIPAFIWDPRMNKIKQGFFVLTYLHTNNATMIRLSVRANRQIMLITEHIFILLSGWLTFIMNIWWRNVKGGEKD